MGMSGDGYVQGEGWVPNPPMTWNRHTVNKRVVRILLECFLVCFTFAF